MLAVIPAPVSANASGSIPGISAICSIIVLAKSAAPSGSARVAVDATLAIYLDGVSGTPKYKGALSEDNTAALIALKGDKSIAEIKGESVDLDDGVYKLGKGYVDIRDGKIFDVREIISSFIED